MNHELKRIVTLFSVLVFAGHANGQRPSPVIEYSSILSSLDAYHTDGRIQFEDDNAALAAVFLPDNTPVDVVITEDGSQRPLVIQPFAIGSTQGVFNRLGIRGGGQQFKFSKPGNYVATYRAGGKPITVVPFSVDIQTNDDQFDPKTYVYLDGPWQDWSYLFASVEKGAEANPELHFWVRKKSFLTSPAADEYTAEIRKAGDVVAVSESGASNSRKWQFMRLRFIRPESKGSGPILMKDLVATEGEYQVIIRRNGEDFATYTLPVAQGQVVLHPRQQTAYQPRTDYIVPRFPGLLGTLGSESAGHAFWMRRREFNNNADSTVQKTPSEEELSRWKWLPRGIDPNRKFQLNVTGVRTRSDTGLAVGEDLIVFGTGFPRGVAYIKPGDNQAREIPGGETYSSKVFGVCGTKIILVSGKQIFIFDTETQQLTGIPETEVSLYSPSELTFDTSGFLVATVNDVARVDDKTILKVIDVSGSQPVVIPVSNSDYTHRDVTSVSVDSSSGSLAVSSVSKKLVAAASVVRNGKQTLFPVDEFQGVGPQKIFLENDWLTYPDADWKVRLMKFGSPPRAITEQSFPRAGNGFFVRKGRLVVASPDGKVGSRYPFAVGDLDDSPNMHASTGKAIPGTSASLGMGGSAAIAIDKTVFIAGTAGDSIGVGERLQLFSDELGWRPVLDDKRQPLAASEVVTSMGLLAFKTQDESGKTVIGYATYGQRVDYESPKLAASNGTGSIPPKMANEGNGNATDASKRLTEVDEAFLVEVLKNEALVYEAYRNVMSAAEAKRKVTEGSLQTLRSSDREHLIDEYRKRSKL